MEIARLTRSRSWQAAVMERLDGFWKEGKYEELEAEAREFGLAASRLRNRGRRRALQWYARIMAAGAACAHGRGAHVLGETEALAAELREADGTPAQELLLMVRSIRMAVVRAHTGGLDLATAEALHGLGRRTEAETAARQALTGCERSLHPEHPRIRRARIVLAEIEEAAR